MTTATLLQSAAAGGAIYCALAYIYGFIWKPKGNRQMHVASLLFTGLALAIFAAVLPSMMSTSNAFALFCATLFLIGSIVCQSFAAYRGRGTDRRADDRRDRADASAAPV